MTHDAARPSRSAPRRPDTGDLAAIRDLLHSHADEQRARISRSFFKTGPGQYGEGDVFIGVSVPDVRRVAKAHRAVSLEVIVELLKSDVHEERLLALIIFVDAFERGDGRLRRQLHDLYLAHTAFVNNWDLVDSSAPTLVGKFLDGRGSRLLTKLARSASLWERRIAIIATFHDIRQQRFDETLRIADLLLADDHDLIHKAVGWMLREVGNRDGDALRGFLDGRYERMPRTMLRYAIERMPETERKRYLLRNGSRRRKISGGVSASKSSSRSRSSAIPKPKP